MAASGRKKFANRPPRFLEGFADLRICFVCCRVRKVVVYDSCSDFPFVLPFVSSVSLGVFDPRLAATSTLSWVLRKRAQRHLREEVPWWFRWLLHSFSRQSTQLRVFWYLLNIRLTNFQKDRVVIHTRFFFF